MQKQRMSGSISKKNYSDQGIYLIEIDKHSYIGSATCFYSRWQDHRKRCRKGNGVNSKFQNAYNKYGEDRVFLSVLEVCNDISTEELLQKEKDWIEKMDPDLNINRDPTKVPITIINNQNCSSKKIYQYTLDGDFVAEYPSISEAGRVLNLGSRTIACAVSGDPKYKSAHGFQWSFEKVDKMPKYVNNSALSKIVSVYILDLKTLQETKYNSIADAVRSIGDYLNFNSECAIMSCVASHKSSFYKLRYMVRYENNKYVFSNRKTAIYNSALDKIYKNAKVAADELNLNKDTIRAWCKSSKHPEWMYLEERAREKFRESGKLQYWTTLIEDL